MLRHAPALPFRRIAELRGSNHAASWLSEARRIEKEQVAKATAAEEFDICSCTIDIASVEDAVDILLVFRSPAFVGF